GREDLQKILRRSATILGVALDEDGGAELAGRARGTPRIANRLLRRVRDFAEVRAQGRITRTVSRDALALLDVDEAGFGKVERARYTYDEYRRFEEATDAKHEYIDGEILALAGGTPEHAALAAAVIAELSRQLVGGPCTTFTSDLRVRVRATGLATYPDATVI